MFEIEKRFNISNLVASINKIVNNYYIKSFKVNNIS